MLSFLPLAVKPSRMTFEQGTPGAENHREWPSGGGSPPDGPSSRPAGPARARSIIPTLIGLQGLLLAGLLWAGGLKLASETPAATLSQPTAPSPLDSLAAEVNGLKATIEVLAAQLKGVQDQLTALPKPTPPPDLRPLQNGLGELRTSSEKLAGSMAMLLPLGDRVSKLEAGVAASGSAMQGVKDRMAALAGQVERLKSAQTAAAPRTPAPPPAIGRPSLAQAVDLFKAGKYAEAQTLLKKLEADHPIDARVFYYQAFVRALTTNDWQGRETLELASKGAALERSGATRAGDVEAAFADLPANLKDWLRFFRSQGAL